MKNALAIALKGLLFFILSYSFSANAQRVYACKTVSADGDPVGLNQFFYIAKEGGQITLLVKLPYEVNATGIEFKFFTVDSLNKETFSSTVPMKVEKGWTWFRQYITFNFPARYKVYVYADKEKFLCSETIDVYVK